MSKTIASVLCETNQMRGLPQENVFLQNLYRLPPDFSASFQRTATSTAPVQICALASAQADDTIGAMALQEVMKILSAMVNQAQTHSFLDFELFINQFITAANASVCNLSISNHGAPVRVSLSMIVIEGDTLRIMSVGNTRAVLIRQGRVISLSEDQTVAHRYVQLGAILPDAENTHPERSVLTQYIGRFPQDGPILPEKQIYMKLSDGDEICLLGTGITQGLSDYVRNSVLLKTVSPEEKSGELIGRCVQNNVKGGLTVLHLRIENTLLMPAGAYMPGAGAALAAAGTAAAVIPSAMASTENGLQADGSSPEMNDNPNARAIARKRAKTIAIIRPIAIFLGCILVGYLSMMLFFNIGNLMKPSSSAATDSNGSAVVLNKVMYVNADLVALYPDASLNNEPIVYLSRGDVVTLNEVAGSFSKVTTIESTIGYIVSSMLSDSDPTIGETNPEMADPTPIPSELPTAVTTSGAAETTPAPTTETAATESQTSATSETTAATSSSDTSATTSSSDTSATTGPTTPVATTTATTPATTSAPTDATTTAAATTTTEAPAAPAVDTIADAAPAA